MTPSAMPEGCGVIRSLSVRRLAPRLRAPWGPGVDALQILVVTVTSDNGESGIGFTWTPAVGASAIEAMLVDDITPFVTGQTPGPSLWDDVARHLRDVGAGGVVTLALAGLDLALWDLAGRSTDRSVISLLSPDRVSCDTYASGINWHADLTALESQVGTWVAAGVGAVKIKVGPPRSHDEDRRRVALVRGLIGPDRRLMLDANQRWCPADAVTAINDLACFDLTWIEEPVDANDVAGAASVAASVAVPIALGENLYTGHQFAHVIDSGAASVIQPSVARVGGITPFLHIAALAEERGVAVAPHLLPEVSGPLATALATTTIVEVPDGALLWELGVLAQPPPIRIAGDRLTVVPHSGLGLDFVDHLLDGRPATVSAQPRPPHQETLGQEVHQ